MIEKKTPPQINVQNLNVVYNEGRPNEMKALRKADLKIYPQEYVIIFGPSGCGKSTLLYSIAGLQKPTSGEVWVDSDEIYSLDKKKAVDFHQHKIGMIFQAFHLIPSLNIIDNICLPKAAAGDGAKEREEVSGLLLKRFGISNQAQKFPNEISGGQKQRVSISRALANNPDIILADEPVGNLDSVSAHNVMKILQELNENDKKTIILVTHDPTHLRYGDRIIYLRDGEIIKEKIVKDKVSVSDESPKREGEGEEAVTEKVPLDLKMLMEAFKTMSLSQVGLLLIPFKAQQLASHVLFPLSFDQLDRTTKALEELLSSHKSFEQLIETLDSDLAAGGAGWDKRKAHSFTHRIKEIIDQTSKIDLNRATETSQGLTEYLSLLFDLNLSSIQKDRMGKLIIERLQNLASVQDVQREIDLPLEKGGIGLDKRVAVKITREIEILLLIHYGK